MRLLLCLFLASALLAAACPRMMAAEDGISVGMAVEVEYALSWYKGYTLAEILPDGRYRLKKNETGELFTYAADRLRNAAGVPFAQLRPGAKEIAGKAQEQKGGVGYFLGVWNTGGLSREPGLVRINADHTYEHNMFSNTPKKGEWKENTGSDGGIRLIKGTSTGDDFIVTRREKGQIFLQREIGGAGYTGTLVP
jgi:hypothetical protein